MGLELEPGRAPNGRGESSVVDLLALQEGVRDVASNLKTLSERFEAHAEQEEERSRRVDTRLDELAKKIDAVPALPTALLANLFAQSGEGAGPTGTGALVVSGVVGLISIVLPRVLAWWTARSRTP